MKIKAFELIAMKKLFIYFLLLCWGYIMRFTKVLIINLINHSCIHSLHHSPLSPLPHSGNLLAGIISPLTYMCIQYCSRTDLFCPSVLRFCKKTKWHFYLLNVAIQGVFLCHFQVRMYYNLNWFTSFKFFLLSTLFPFS
jgi:hypothetical protein